MSSRDILSLIEDMIEGRNYFLSNETIRSIPFHDRHSILSRYMANEFALVDLMARIHNRQAVAEAATTLLTFTIPAGFTDPVPVLATQAQITASLEDRLSMTGNCAVCQDAISGAGCQSRQCGHSFHRGCIVNWLSLSVRCPVCRHDIREASPPNGTSPASS